MTQPTPNGRPLGAPRTGMELVAPTVMAVDAYPAGTPTAIVLRISTCLGPLHFIFSPDEAIQIGGHLRQQGKAAKSGLVLPDNVRLPADSDDPTLPE